MSQVVDPEAAFFLYTCECDSAVSRSCYCPLFEDYSVKCANAGLYDASIIPQFCRESPVEPTSSATVSTKMKQKPTTSIRASFSTTSMKVDEKTDTDTERSTKSSDPKTKDTSTVTDGATIKDTTTESDTTDVTEASTQPDSDKQTKGQTATTQKSDVLPTTLTPSPSPKVLFYCLTFKSLL